MNSYCTGKNFKTEITVTCSESELLQIFPFKRNIASRERFHLVLKDFLVFYPEL